MILPDANLLLYAYYPRATQHEASKTWLEEILSGTEMVRFSWQTVWAFLRISTNSKVFEQPLSISEAVSIVSSWLDRPNVGVVNPEARHWQILSLLLENSQCTGPLVTDATLAAIALEHGGTLYTTDRDFSRFDDLNWKDPLTGQ